MKVILTENYDDSSRIAADIVENIIRKKKNCTLGLATGSSPVGMYQELIRRGKEEGLDFSAVSTVNLDEYVGLEPTHPQSYRYFMNEKLFDHINIDKANTYVVSGSGDVEKNQEDFNRVLDQTEIDIQVLGVGPDGHLGFNEPSDHLTDGAHLETLDESTIDANKRFFASREEVPVKALTMGIGNIMRAASLLLIISGAKEEAARELLMTSKITTSCPVTFMKMHRNATVLIERSLAVKIGFVRE